MGKVLVADDEVIIRQALRALLEEAGHDIVEAADGQEALDLIAKNRPEVVLLDVVMPSVGGFEVLRALRNEASTRSLPVVMVTVRDTPADRAEAIRLGVVDYVAKPWKPGEIELRIKWALKGGGTVPAVPWQQSGATAEYPNSLMLDAKTREAPAPEPKVGADLVTPEKGGSVLTEDGAVQVDVPAGAVRDEMTLGALPATQDRPPGDATLRVRLHNTIADMTFTDRTGTPIEGIRLDKSVRISINYTEEDVALVGNEDDLTILKYMKQSGEWVGLETSVDRETRRTVAHERQVPRPVFTGEERGKVLIVEDEESARMPIIDALEGLGYEVIHESDGAKVSRRVVKDKPDVVLLDLSLPGSDGFQVLRKLKGDPATRSTSVIIMSSSTDAHELATSMTLGARDYIAKPSQMGDLQSRVKRAFASSRARMRQAERAVARARARLRGNQRRNTPTQRP